MAEEYQTQTKKRLIYCVKWPIEHWEFESTKLYMVCVLVINYFCQVQSNPHGMISLFDICRCFIFVTGMHEGEDEEMDVCPTPRALLEIGQGPTHRVPRVKSAHTPQKWWMPWIVSDSCSIRWIIDPNLLLPLLLGETIRLFISDSHKNMWLYMIAFCFTFPIMLWPGNLIKVSKMGMVVSWLIRLPAVSENLHAVIFSYSVNRFDQCHISLLMELYSFTY